jgi:hypothetical protein
MTGAFAELVEEVRNCSPDEKADLLFLLQRDLVEARRDEFTTHAELAKQDYREGRLEFSSSIADLKRSVGAT